MTEQETSRRRPGRRRRLWFAAAVSLLALAVITVAAPPVFRTPGTSNAGVERDDETEAATAAPDDVPVLEVPPRAPADPSADSEGDVPGNAQGDDADRASQPDPALEAAVRRQPDDERAIGTIDAPVVLVQWADFLCGFCRRFTAEIEPVLIERFVETGLLRIEWRDLPIGADEEAVLAAVGGHAAAAQGAFFAYRDLLYAAELRRGQGQLTRALLLDTAAALDLDVEQFAADLDAAEHAVQVSEDAELGGRLGVDRTPTVGIGGYLLPGLAPLEEYVRLIEFVALEAGAPLP